MAVARIVTRSPEEVGPLADQLRARGYSVEIVAPNETREGPAELEIVAEACAAAAAFDRAAELARPSDADVLVAPGLCPLPEAAPPEAAPPSATDISEPVEPAPVPWREEVEHAERSSMVRDLLVVAGAGIGNLARTFGASMRKTAVAGRAFAGHLSGSIAARRAVWRQQRPAALAAPPVKRIREPRLPVIRRTRERDTEWKVAAVFAMVLAVAITLAWAAATRHASVSPIPASMLMRSNSMEQKIPFGPVTLRPAPVPVPPKASAAVSTPAARAAASRRSSRDYGEEEVVVRHFAPARAPATAQRQDGVKRISDMQ
jgi:hypothetical protein